MLKIKGWNWLLLKIAWYCKSLKSLIFNQNCEICDMFFIQVLTAIGNFCICSIAVGMILEIIVMYPIQHRSYRSGINNLLVLLIGGIPIAMPTVLSVTLAIGSHRLSQQVLLYRVKVYNLIELLWDTCFLSYTSYWNKLNCKAYKRSSFEW